jgi:hypothetical protein
MGRWKVMVRAGLRRLVCPAHGVRVEAVPFARYRSGLRRDFGDLIAFLATKTDKTTISGLCRVDWDSVGRICQRVVADGLDPGRLDGLVSIGVDEVSWRRHHRYLTLVTDHTGKKIVSSTPPRPTSRPRGPTSSRTWPTGRLFAPASLRQSTISTVMVGRWRRERQAYGRSAAREAPCGHVWTGCCGAGGGGARGG